MNYNLSTIKSSFISVLGFEQPQDPQFDTLSSDLLSSTSGQIINDSEIPYLTLENIKSLSRNYNDYFFNEYNSATTYITGNRVKYTYPTYSALSTYATGERVVYLGIGYKSLVDSNSANQPDENFDKWQVLNDVFAIYDSNVDANLNNQPDLNSTEWTETVLFNSFLESRLKYSIVNVLQKVIENKNTILESKKVYYGIGDGTVTITNNNKLAGLKIDFIKKQNIKLKLNKIGLHFTGAETDITFYVFNQNTQQTTFTASCTSNDFVWVDVSDLEISSDKEGSWFIYYDQSSITESAVNNERTIPTNISNFVKFNQFLIDSGTDLKTVDSGDYVYSQSLIANIDYSILPDLTEWLVDNKNIFAKAIKYQFATDIYKMFISNDNVRTNKAERNIDINLVRASVFSEDNNSVHAQLNEQIELLRNSIGKAKIDNINLPKSGNLYSFSNDL